MRTPTPQLLLTQHTLDTAGAKQNTSTSVGQPNSVNHAPFFFNYKYEKAKITTSLGQSEFTNEQEIEGLDLFLLGF